jgi:flagellin
VSSWLTGPFCFPASSKITAEYHTVEKIASNFRLIPSIYGSDGTDSPPAVNPNPGVSNAMLSILNNTASQQAQSALSMTNSNLTTSLQRLSTGLQINSGADGPAAYVISQAQQAQVAGLNQAIQNTNQAVDLVQTGDGALNEISNLLTQVRGLALDSANSGVNNAEAQAANQAQIANALSTINTIATSTQFNGNTLLNGSAGYNAVTSNSALSGLNATSSTTVGTFGLAITQNAQEGQVNVGAGANQATALNNANNLSANETLTFNGSVQVNLTQGMTNTQVVSAINAETSQTGVVASLDSTGNLELTAQNFGQNFTVQSSVAAATAGSTGIGTTLVNTNSAPAGIVTLKGQNLTGTITNPDTSTTNFTGNGNVVSLTTGEGGGLSFTVNANPANSAISNTAANGASIVVNNGTLQFQIGANAGQTASLAISNMQTTALGTGLANNQFASLAQINVSTASSATNSISVIDAAISQVSNLAATLGAFQTNTLQANATNLQTSLTNTQSAESTITNTNYASEIASFTQLQTQMQAGSSVLTNANQSNQFITQMLQQM